MQKHEQNWDTSQNRYIVSHVVISLTRKGQNISSTRYEDKTRPLTLIVYRVKEIRSAIIVGTVIKEVTLCSLMASHAKLASNLGIITWQPPAINMAMADDIPPIWHRGAV